MKTPSTRKPKPVKPVFEVINCANCGSPFQPKREWQKFCKPTCRFTVGNKKRERVIAVAKEFIRMADNNFDPLPPLWDDHVDGLRKAVNDLNKDGERPSNREKPRKP